jgi:hypothetical protein
VTSCVVDNAATYIMVVKFRNTIWPPPPQLSLQWRAALSSNSNGSRSVYSKENPKSSLYHVRCLWVRGMRVAHVRMTSGRVAPTRIRCAAANCNRPELSQSWGPIVWRSILAVRSKLGCTGWQFAVILHPIHHTRTKNYIFYVGNRRNVYPMWQRRLFVFVMIKTL